MKNSYIIVGDKVHIQLSNGPIAVIDLADLPVVAAAPNTWYATRRKHTSYAFMNTGGRTAGKMLVMHRVIMGADVREVHVDHIDMDGLNNTRTNMRLCTASENAQNIPVKHPSSQTGVRGVTPFRGRFRARVKVRGREYHLGVFDTIEAASAAAAAGRLEHHTHSPEATEVASAA